MAVAPPAAPQPPPVAVASPANGTESATGTPAPPASAFPHPATAPAPLLAGDAFEIVVASFRTTVRANEVAAEVVARGEPARVRSAAGWQQVIAGPYTSRAKGQEAQQRLTQAGFAGTQLGPAIQP
jgi:cell division protein FtsN